MKVIIAEKPSVARDIAKVLKLGDKKEGYIIGKDYSVTWAFGHLIQLVNPDDYDDKYKNWELKSLPIIPTEFKKAINDDSGARRQFETIKRLICDEKTTEVICATDAGREGELIFRYIYDEAACDKPIKRLWISSQTDAAIKEGFDNLEDGKKYEPLYDSARCRSEADWMIGMNATRAYTIHASNGTGVMSVGRVQTPVLKMIVDRYKANVSFKPETFFELWATFKHPNGEFDGKWFKGKEDRFYDKSVAEKMLEDVQKTGAANISSMTQKQKKENPPLLYDLTEIQRDANKRFKYSADQTLKIMQSLYETHKVVTYPRTSSRYLSKDMEPKLPGLIKNAMDIEDYAPFAAQILEEDKLPISKRIVDDKKVTDHHAIIPTEKKANLGTMNLEERRLYDLVLRRFLSVFMPLCLKDHTEIITKVGAETFKTTGTIVTQEGWRAIYQNTASETADGKTSKRSSTDSESGKSTKKKEKKEDEELELPKVQKGDDMDLAKVKLNEGKTKAPPLYNEASLLGAMETAGKNIEDEELREAMKDCGLGTPATRASIVERLIQVKYINREKNKLIPTDKGIYLVSIIKDKELMSPELTGTWEKKLNDMAQGHYQRKEYMEEIQEFTEQIIDNVKEEAKKEGTEERELGPCMKCENGKVIATPKAYGCNTWKETNCDFVIWKEVAGKELKPKHIKQLLEKKETELIKGFKSKAGKEFDAQLVMGDDLRVTFKFDDKPKGKCPLCQADVISTMKSYSCANWKETSCKFVIWKEIAKKQLPEETVKELLESGETKEPVSGFKSKAGNDFDARLKLVEGRVQFVFDN